MRCFLLPALTAAFLSFSSFAQAQSNACDLTQDGSVTFADVAQAVNLTLGAAPCTANIQGASVCNAAVVQRVINALMGASCVTSAAGASGHSVLINWTASVSPNLKGYNIYRAPSAAGPYVKLNLTLIGQTSYSDGTVQAGQTYFYVVTAVDINGSESGFSNPPTQATIPTP